MVSEIQDLESPAEFLLYSSYRRWKLGDDIDLIVRCEHDGVMTGANGEVSFINIKTLNEWDSRVRRTSSPRWGIS